MTDDTITGLTYAGVSINPYNGVPVADARFDNFSMVNLLGSSGSVVSGNRSPFLPNRNLEYLRIVQSDLDR